MGNVSSADLAMTPIPFMEVMLIQRGELNQEEMSRADPGRSGRYDERFTSEVTGQNLAGQPNKMRETATIPSDVLMNDKGMREGLLGVIERFSKEMKG
jgi:hypothetical protein